jgi:transcriptional regulator with XRE-family HTH domain
MTGLDLKILRIRAGMRQYRVAAALGISQTVLSQVENGQRTVPPERLEDMARVVRDLAGKTTPEVARVA